MLLFIMSPNKAKNDEFGIQKIANYRIFSASNLGVFNAYSIFVYVFLILQIERVERQH